LVVPDTFGIATQFRGTIPSSLPSLTIYQRLENDGAAEGLAVWKGIVSSCKFKDHRAELLCLPTTRLLQRSIPRAVYSGQCNNHLYDNDCKVVRTDYRFQGIVTTIGADPTQLTFAGLRTRAGDIDTAFTLGLTSTELDNFWMRGIIILNNIPEERRTIVETYIGGDANVVRVSIPFRGITTGDAVDILAGCTHSIDICNRKFQNAINFGGFPYVPGSLNNPFNIELGAGGGKDGGGSGSGGPSGGAFG
jgi:hypothetical protein